MGADAVELDVDLTKDGVPIVIHDDTVDRTTNGHGATANLTINEIRTLDAGSWKSPKYAGEKIPTLAEVFESIAHKVWINIELKKPSLKNTGLEIKVAQLIQKMNLQQRVIISSFNPFAIRQIKQLDPSLPIALLTSRHDPIYLREAWLAPLLNLAAHHPQYMQLKSKGLKHYQRGGKRVNVWTVDDPPEMKLFAIQGVDGIITNVPEVAKKTLQG
jgi:glycerophosphoryl diester phosphodiesterase